LSFYLRLAAWKSSVHHPEQAHTKASDASNQKADSHPKSIVSEGNSLPRKVPFTRRSLKMITNTVFANRHDGSIKILSMAPPSLGLLLPAAGNIVAAVASAILKKFGTVAEANIRSNIFAFFIGNASEPKRSRFFAEVVVAVNAVRAGGQREEYG
jgi:hypothetical protein